MKAAIVEELFPHLEILNPQKQKYYFGWQIARRKYEKAFSARPCYNINFFEMKRPTQFRGLAKVGV